MHESKESMERFEFLERRNVLVLPGDAESARPIYVEVCDARQSIHSREILELSEEQTVFAERRLAQVSSLRVCHKLIVDGDIFQRRSTQQRCIIPLWLRT